MRLHHLTLVDLGYNLRHISNLIGAVHCYTARITLMLCNCQIIRGKLYHHGKIEKDYMHCNEMPGCQVIS